MPSKQSKIRGLFLGVAIGDQLGRCAEGMTPAQIKKNYGRVTNYRRPANRHWKNKKARVWTDDTQLTLATARAMINAGKFDMSTIAAEHTNAYDESIAGWGGSTREAVERLKNGVHWRESGKTEKADRGHGNGVVMKLAPLVAYDVLIEPQPAVLGEFPRLVGPKDLINFTVMTHWSSPAISGTIAHFAAQTYCLKTLKPECFSPSNFLWEILKKLDGLPQFIEAYCPKLLSQSYNKFRWWWRVAAMEKIEEEVPLEMKMEKLFLLPPMKIKDARAVFGGGDVLVYHSLPFAYYFFLRNPNSFDSVIKVINAGGDTDTTGSIVASLLGALHGEEIFPKHLIRNLQDPELIIDTADKFCKIFA